MHNAVVSCAKIVHVTKSGKGEQAEKHALLRANMDQKGQKKTQEEQEELRILGFSFPVKKFWQHL